MSVTPHPSDTPLFPTLSSVVPDLGVRAESRPSTRRSFSDPTGGLPGKRRVDGGVVKNLLVIQKEGVEILYQRDRNTEVQTKGTITR